MNTFLANLFGVIAFIAKVGLVCTVIGAVVANRLARRSREAAQAEFFASTETLNELTSEAPMLTIVWSNPAVSFDGDSSTVAGDALLCSQDEDGAELSRESFPGVSVEIPYQLDLSGQSISDPADDQIAEVTLVLHSGVADSIGVLMRDGSRRTVQLMSDLH